VHTHTREDEWSFVLAGEVGVEIDGTTTVAGPGDLVLKPRGVPHAFWNAGDAPARLLEVITPGGFEDYFTALAQVLPDLARVAELAQRYGLDVDPASVPRLAQEHGLVLA
jgi:oxalate decarboxylase/phosphoglucose isomerase-like protein (cupin superfamily)